MHLNTLASESGFFIDMSSNFIAQGPDGKPIFTGKSDPDNPPVKPREGSKMECPVCHNMFDYLLGENINGGVQGCEGFMAFAKFYPSGDGIGWYSNVDSEDFNKFFEEHGKHNKMDNYGSFYDLMDEEDDRVELYDFDKRKIIMKLKNKHE